MSQTKAQLIQPIGVVTASNVVVSGVMTASSFDGRVVGSATSVIQGTNLNLGAVNASSFAGDFTGNATGIITSSAIKVGQLTASSFVGDFTGTATSMAKGTGFKAGTVTATPANVTYTVTVGSKTGGGNAFYLDGTEAPTPSLYPGATYTFDQAAATNDGHPLRFATAADAGGSTEYTFQVTTNGTPGNAGAWTKIVVSPSAPDTLYYYCTNHNGMGDSINITNMLQGAVTGAVTGDVKGNITGNITGNVTGDAVGAAGSVLSGSNIHVGVMTATSYYGDASNMTGIAATNFNPQTVTANSGTTAIDLRDGNMITFNQSASTTVSFANTSESMDVALIRVKDSNDTARTLTWPSSIKWNGGTAPTLNQDNTRGTDFNLINLLTRDQGVTWYGWENASQSSSLGLWTFGAGNYGQDAQNNETTYSSPVQISGTTWSKADGAGNHSTGIKSDNTLWAWGWNSNGSLGLNNRTAYSSPTQIGSGTDWSFSIGIGAKNWAIKTDGTLWAWGYGYNGDLGINNHTQYSSPVQMPGTTWRTIQCGGSVASATRTDGTLWVWGQNEDSGSNGKNQTSSNASSPTQIPGTTWSTEHGNGGDQTCYAIKTNGTMWVWGKNNRGQLGQNNLTQYSSPTQLGTETTWSKVLGSADGGGNEGSYGAIKTDGTLWMWGSNNEGGALGQNNQTRYSSPVQVPGTNSVSYTHLRAHET